VPATSASFEVLVETGGRPGPALAAELRAGARRVVGVNVRAGYGNGWVRVPLAHRAGWARAPSNASLCVRNAGASPVALAGAPTGDPPGATINGLGTTAVVSIRWRQEDEAGPSRLATVMERATYGKADLGPWAPLLLLVLVWVGALALVVTRRAA
jgi:hypothetical protein